METILKVENTSEGKKLIAYLKSLKFVKILGDSDSLIDVSELKSKIKKAEKSKSLTIEDALQRSGQWKNKHK